MLYNSTLNKEKKITAAEAIAAGIAPDGGLFVPCEFPAVSEAELKNMLSMKYTEIAELIFSKYLTDFSADEITECVEKAYTKEKFGAENPTPISCCAYNGNDLNILELWHGPTAAFKDMALQILPYFLTKSIKKTGLNNKVVILVATSGDTGKAALEGFKDVDGTGIIVFYPKNGVSPMQKRQMCTQEGNNVCVCAIKGNFDDAQTGVKAIFTDERINNVLRAENKQLSSANSINLGRLLPQVVYYFSAYLDLVNKDKIYMGEKVNITVPTGNFGNILASYYAFRMGLPVNKFICASNSNDVLTEFINTGVYNKNRTFYTTYSPSMDILVSSNLERLLYHITNENCEMIKELMLKLKTCGKYEVDSDIMEKISEMFYGACCSDKETQETIGRLYSQSGYLCDTHTAVAINVYDKYVNETGDKTPCIIASTASPYKFCKAVLGAVGDNLPANEFEMADALNRLTGVDIPKPIAELKDKKVRFKDTIEISGMPGYVTKNA